jgi:hypothetical protein
MIACYDSIFLNQYNMTKTSICIIVFNLTSFLYAHGQSQTNYAICKEQSHNKLKYVFTNLKGNTVLRLDSAEFEKCFTDTLRYFAIVRYKNKKGFWAIDKHKKVLFSVFDPTGEGIYPDRIYDDMLRIVDKNGKIGFANSKGEIILINRLVN